VANVADQPHTDDSTIVQLTGSTLRIGWSIMCRSSRIHQSIALAVSQLRAKPSSERATHTTDAQRVKILPAD